MPTIVLTEAERKLLVYLLEIASEEYSNHGCNDFDAGRLGLTTQEIRDVRGALYPDDYVPLDSPYLMDWLLMSGFAKRFREAE